MSKTEEKKVETVNKSELIRQHLKTMKPSERSPTAVAEAMTKKGVKVTPSFVSVVKLKMKTKGKKKPAKAKVRKKAAAKTSRNINSFFKGDFGNLILAKDFLNATGGVDQAKRVLDIVSKLVS